MGENQEDCEKKENEGERESPDKGKRGKNGIIKGIIDIIVLGCVWPGCYYYCTVHTMGTPLSNNNH